MWRNGARQGAVAGVLAMAMGGLAACDETTSPAGSEQVAVAFAGGGSALAASSAGGMRALLAQPMSIEGTNGTLVIEDLRIIVAEFELERITDDGCTNLEDDDACEKFEAPPAFVDVPLDGGQVVAVTAVVDPDTYDELDFEIEDLDDDEEDPVKAQQIEELMTAILAEFPDWPREASMLVTGTFTPTGGAPQAFRVYFEAEVEIEMELNPPVTVTDDGTGATFTVNIDPSFWFSNPDGTVRNLAELDYDATGAVVEFEVEIEDGFTELDFDDDDDGEED